MLTDSDAAAELLKALRRREHRVLDVLVECLMDQEEAHRELIKKIRDGMCGYGTVCVRCGTICVRYGTVCVDMGRYV